MLAMALPSPAGDGTAIGAHKTSISCTGDMHFHPTLSSLKTLANRFNNLD
jgi:hypothetical protein